MLFDLNTLDALRNSSNRVKKNTLQPSLKIECDWKYDHKKKEVIIKMDQVQTDGSVFEIPIEFAVYSSEDKPPFITKKLMKSQSNQYTIRVESEAVKIFSSSE